MAPSLEGLRLYLPPSMWLAKPPSWPRAVAAVKHWQLRVQLGQLVGLYSAKLFLEPDLLSII